MTGRFISCIRSELVFLSGVEPRSSVWRNQHKELRWSVRLGIGPVRGDDE